MSFNRFWPKPSIIYRLHINNLDLYFKVKELSASMFMPYARSYPATTAASMRHGAHTLIYSHDFGNKRSLIWSSGLADGALISSIGAPCFPAAIGRGVGDHESLPRFLDPVPGRCVRSPCTCPLCPAPTLPLPRWPNSIWCSVHELDSEARVECTCQHGESD